MSKSKPASRHSSGAYNLDLFLDEAGAAAVEPPGQWPDPHRFPLNVARQRVSDQVLADLRASREPLIVTGYAALDQVIDFVAAIASSSRVRVLFGAEPFPSRRDSFEVAGRAFPAEVEVYWLARGISLRLSARLIDCIERLRDGTVEVRYLGSTYRRLHAKIYVGDSAATTGSSNFTRPGLEEQWEANVRFSRDREGRRYRELRDIAENYWSLGEDYREELIALLERLLQVVPWNEALGHACAELLEGDWAEPYLRQGPLPDEASLWPAQRQGIAQALYILSRQGSVLVADATGSGKTRMGAHLIRAIRGQIARSGRLRQGKSLMICPPAVAEAWEWEAHLSGTSLDVYSHGILSHPRSGKHDLTLEALRRAQVLCVDEGHNFLNIKSNRTQHLLRNMADHVLLFTATPINRSVVDMLRIADMLGADNLAPSTLKAFRKLLGVRNINRSLTEEEITALRKEIQRFTVRRTKRLLNHLIDREPDAYRDRRGRPCRFPKHKPRFYRLDEPERDREIAAEIRRQADRLYAVSHFVRPLEMPDALQRQGRSEASYLQSRLMSARKIARYQVMAALRSSRAALAEHVAGTTAAVELFDLSGFRKHNETGNMLATLSEIAGRIPRNRLDVELPEWLTDKAAHIEACEHDHRIYARILELVRKMSARREQRKVQHLLTLAAQHPLLLAFDRHPVTLAVICQGLEARHDAPRTIVATGDPGSGRADILETFRPGSEQRGVIGLCSDSLSEGVNLQQASALVHLDMPSVVRIAEQRAGRIDRMDSPHAEVEVWWPDDAPEFALSSDERFVERYEAVESLLGSNMPLPEHLQTGETTAVRVADMVEEFERQVDAALWDGLHDAFEPVRELVEGDAALVPGAVYDHCRGLSVPVLARVSVVRSDRPWGFVCIAAGAFRAPHWVFLPELDGAPVTDLQAVCTALRERLGDGGEDLPFDDTAASCLERILARLADVERSLLPLKKQRALEEMDCVLAQFAEQAGRQRDADRLDHFRAILQMLRNPGREYQPDWDEVAARWLDIIRPVWYRKLQQKRRKPLLLKDIRQDLLAEGDSFGDRVIETFRSFPALPSADERVSACIIGVV